MIVNKTNGQQIVCTAYVNDKKLPQAMFTLFYSVAEKS